MKLSRDEQWPGYDGKCQELVVEQQKTKKLKTQIASWSEIRGDVRKVNPEFADILDSLNLQEEPYFCKVDYPYGSPILDKEKIFITNDHNRSVPVDSTNISERHKKFFDGISSPLIMVLEKGISHSLEGKKQFVPLYMFHPGQFYGLWELFDRNHSLFDPHQWNLYAGARSLFSTAKISNITKYQTIKKKFNLKAKPPKYLKDHHALFTELANHPSLSCNWTTLVLFFSRHFQEQLLTKKDTTCPLRAYFLEYIWRQSMPWRFEAMMGWVWNRVSGLLKRNQFKNFTLQLSILKHVVKVALGALPCFISNDPDELTAPLSLIKEILIDEYKSDFCPTIMVPEHLSNGKNRFGYYSVNESMLVEETYTNKSKKTSIETMRSIYEIYEFVKNSMSNDNARIKNDMVKLLTDKMKLDFFHSIFDQRELLQMSSILPDQDPSLTKLPKKYGKSVLPFNENGSFFRGLIRININDFPL